MESREVDNLILMYELSLSKIENHESKWITESLFAGILLIIVAAEVEWNFIACL